MLRLAGTAEAGRSCRSQRLANVPDVVRWLSALAVGAVVSGFAFLLVTGRYLNDGAVLARVTENHGVHQGDLFVIAGWLVAMVCLVHLAATGGRRDKL
jgi:hypothetical protein